MQTSGASLAVVAAALIMTPPSDAQMAQLDTRWGCQAERRQEGLAAGDHLGQTLSAGDVNGDGFPDVIVGAPNNPFDVPGVVTYPGLAFVFAGTNPQVWGQTLSGSGGTLLTSAFLPHAMLQGDAGNAGFDDRFGWSVAGVGDVDGDGYDDVVAGAPRAGATDQPYMFSGSGNGYADLFLGTSVATAIPIEPPVTDRAYMFGHALAGGDDLGDDGLPEILVGCPLYSVDQNRQGAVYVYSWDGIDDVKSAFGSTQPVTFPVTGTDPFLDDMSMFGWSVATVGQFDPDSLPPNPHEFVAGALLTSSPAFDPSVGFCIGDPEIQDGRQCGRALVISVIEDDDPVVQALYFGEASETSDRTRLGTSVAAGNFEGGVVVDIAAGGSGYTSDTVNERGKLYVFFNPADAD